jgi:hypothetical protein
MRGFEKSGWQDSNLRSLGPKPSALTGLRYTPQSLKWFAKVFIYF